MSAVNTLQAIVYRRGSLKILDQTQLPHETKYLIIPDVNSGWKCIHLMQVSRLLNLITYYIYVSYR